MGLFDDFFGLYDGSVDPNVNHIGEIDDFGHLNTGFGQDEYDHLTGFHNDHSDHGGSGF